MGQDGQIGKGATADMTKTAFESLRAKDARNEVRILWSEIGVIAFLDLLLAAYLTFA